MAAAPSRPKTVRAQRAAHQRGLSLVEMLVGIAIGLFIVAAATLLVSSQLTENRKLLLETQVQQDLRATADILTRELRRAGYNLSALNNVWMPDRATAAPVANGRAPIDLSVARQATYQYERGSDNQFGVRLNAGTIERRIGSGGWQPMTDHNTLRVTEFTIEPQVVASLPLACSRLCAGDTQACWPKVDVRDLVLTLRGEAASDASVKRELTSRVRVRNDEVEFNAPGAQACP